MLWIPGPWGSAFPVSHATEADCRYRGRVWKATTMSDVRCGVCRAGMLLGIIVALAGCTYAAIQRLSPAEQAEFRIYRKVMTPAQVRAYLSQPTAAERTAYLEHIGLVQRFQALDPLDREAVLNGVPRVGMSTEALRFLWGDPYYTKGDPKRYAHWYYLGSSFSLADTGNQYANAGQRVDVYIVNDRVVWWVDYDASESEEESGFFRWR
jgi:hypothetical protein